MKRICLIFVVIGFLPGVATALGLGNLTLDSGLNQPFEARIELLSPTAEELSSLRIQLAGVDAFRRAHIERLFVLSQLRFEVEVPESGSDYIRVYSEQPIREPYLNFLVEASWSKGRLFREYTVLLDPPLYNPYPEKQAPVAASRPATTTRTPAETAPAPATAPAPTPTPVQSAVYEGGGSTGTEYGPINAGESLWSIASKIRPDASISIQQMMLALLRTNPDAFINNNINGLKRGKILRMPDKEEIMSLSQAEAIRETRSQNSMWEELRAAAAETTPVRPVTTETKQPAAAISTEEEEAELRLVTPGGEGEGQAGAAAEGTLDKDLALATEQLETATQENQELKDRLAESDSVINDLKRLVQLKDDELAALQQQVAEAQTGGEAGTPEETAEQEGMAEEQAPETEETTPQPQEQAAPEKQVTAPAVISEPTPSGIVDQVKQVVMDNLIMIGGAVAVVFLVIVVLVIIARRQSSAKEEIVSEAPAPAAAVDEGETIFGAGYSEAEAVAGIEVEESESITETREEEKAADLSDEEAEAPTEVAEFEEEPPEEPTEEATEVAPIAAEQPAEFEEEPLAEVNVFLAYEHFDQAEEFVRNAIEGNPENLDYHMKLLEVFYAAGNKASYEEEAKVLHDLVNGQGSHWDMATAMWQEMSPNRALFAEPVEGEEEKAEEEAGGMLDLTAAEGQASDKAKPEAGLDFDFGAEAEGAPSDEGVLDISAPSPEEDILDVTAAVSAGESDQDLLDVTAAVGVDSEPTEEGEIPVAQAEEENILNISAQEEPVLDITSEPEESVLDITATNEGIASGEDLLDVSKVSGEDLLDVTSQTEFEEQEVEEDLLDVTSSTSAGADSDELLEIEEAGEIKGSEVGEESNALEFDIGGTEPGVSEEAAPEGEENIIEFDTGTGDLAEDTVSLDAQQESGSEDLELSLDESGGESGAEIDLTVDEEGASEISLEDTLEVPNLEMESTEGDSGLELELEPEEESDQESEGLDMESTVEVPKLDLEADEEDEGEDDEHTVFVPRSTESQEQSQEDEVATKLDLAKAYVELGDKDSAKGILEEILADGNEQQRTQAQELLKQI